MEKEFIQNIFKDLLIRGYNRDTLKEKYRVFLKDKDEIIHQLHSEYTNDRETLIEKYKDQYIRSIPLLCKIPIDLKDIIANILDSNKSFKECYDELYKIDVETISIKEDIVLHICYHLKDFIINY